MYLVPFVAHESRLPEEAIHLSDVAARPEGQLETQRHVCF
jgi:hypothetical protein